MTEAEQQFPGSSDRIMRVGDRRPTEDLPDRSPRQVEIDERFGLDGPPLVKQVIQSCNRLLGGGMVADRFMTQWRAAGLRRPGMVAYLIWPRLRTRLALGIDPPLAHAVVDHLLGYERTAAESRLQISPVEWGVLGFLIASGLESLEDQPGPLGPWDLLIDRVGPDPFEVTGLGPVVTWRWRVRVGSIAGSARLWLPEALVTRWLEAETKIDQITPRPARSTQASHDDRMGVVAEEFGEWRVEAGRITIDQARNDQALTPGQLLLIDNAPLSGTIALPTGNVILRQPGITSRRWLPGRLESDPERLMVRLTSSIQNPMEPRLPLTAKGTNRPEEFSESHEDAVATRRERATLEEGALPLTVELGRINLSLGRVMELQAGDLVKLDRQSGDPVDLTSNGRLIARGELIQIDTELGVRVI